MNIDLENKTTKQLVDEFVRSSHTTEGDNRYSAAIHAKAAEETVSAIQRSAETSEKLNLWLTRWTAVIAIATFINVFATLVFIWLGK